jgi:hypothetical protein
MMMRLRNAMLYSTDSQHGTVGMQMHLTASLCDVSHIAQYRGTAARTSGKQGFLMKYIQTSAQMDCADEKTTKRRN